jgi:hypothetical protein
MTMVNLRRGRHLVARRAVDLLLVGRWRQPRDLEAVGGRPAVPVTRGGGIDAEESWDGRDLYYTTVTFPGGTGVWRVPVAGGEETEIVPLGRVIDLFGMAVAREGLYYSTKTRKGGNGVFTVEYLDLASGRVRAGTPLVSAAHHRKAPSLVVTPRSP